MLNTFSAEPKMLEAVEILEKVSETFTKAKQEMKQNLLSKLEAVAAESEEAKLSGFTKDVKKTENLNMLLSSLKVKENPKEKKAFARKEQNKKMGWVEYFLFISITVILYFI